MDDNAKIAEIALYMFLFVIGFAGGLIFQTSALNSCRATEQQAIDAMTALDKEASFWKNEFDGCDTMNEAIPTLAANVMDLQFQLAVCQDVQTELEEQIQSCTPSDWVLQIEAYQQMEQIERCQTQYSCWSCFYKTKDLSWCMEHIYRPELEP